MKHLPQNHFPLPPPGRPFFSISVAVGLILARACLECAAAQTPELVTQSIPDLQTLLETTIERTPKKISDSAAAISVLTQDDIRRSGATSIPELLRLVPGLNVARVDAHTWAISARGFNDVFANKLLVMMDGRSIYTPLFSGVFWDAQDALLEDIERIEVVRGPGASLWGANAVNGVINIVTRKAAESQGLLVSAGAGTEERGFGAVRFGGKISDNVFFKIYGKYFDRDESATPGGGDAGDSWKMGRGGFRVDWDPSTENSLTLQGDVYSGRLSQDYTEPSPTPPFVRLIPDRFHVGGGNILGRWKHHFSEDSDLQLNANYDRTTRSSSILQEDRDTVDVDLQHEFRLGERQKLIWGVGFRRTSDDVVNSTSVTLNPSRRTSDLYSAFIQDEISLSATNLILTLGTKVEENDFTGLEVQPGVRLLWKSDNGHTVWASVSRAVRTPSRAEDDIIINPAGAPPGFATIEGSRNFDSEKLVACELGYRVQPWAALSLDLTGFYNVYDDLRTIEPTGVFLRSRADNKLEGETYGGEAAVTWQVNSQWRLHAGYSFLEMQLHRKSGGVDAASEAAGEGSSPQHQFFLRSAFDFGSALRNGQRAFEWDSTLRYVSELPAQKIPGYLTLDVRLAWHPSTQWELALVGQNLFDDRHPEFYPTTISTQRTEIERSVYAKLTWRF